MKNTSVKSEEFQDILGKYPSWILRCGISFCGIFILVLLIGSMLFRYPEVVSTSITLTGTQPIEEITINRTGRIMDLCVKNNQEVHSGDYLAVMENAALTADVIALKNYLSTFTNVPQMIETLPSLSWTLGDLQTIYLQFYSTLRQTNHNSITEGGKVDVLLSELRNKIRIWENNYVLRSNISGTAVLFDKKITNQYLSPGVVIFDIIPPPPNTLIGKISLSSAQARNVKIGQEVDIYFENISVQGNTILKGVLTELSLFSHNENYIGYVSFPDTISIFKEKSIKMGMHARAEIVVSSIPLLKHILSRSINYIKTNE